MDIDSLSPETTSPAATPSAPIAPEPIVQSPTVPAPKHRMHPVAVASAVVIVLALGYGAYAYFTNSWPFMPMGEPRASESPSPSASAGPTDAWDNVYEDPAIEHAFSLRYPATVEFQGDAMIGPEARAASGSAESGVSATIGVEATALTDASQLTYPACAQHRTTTTVATYKAISFDGCDLGGPLQVKWIVNAKLYTVTIYADRELVLQVLSTFEVVPYAGWESYWTDEYGFELKLPPTWGDYDVQIKDVPGATAGVQIAYSHTAELPAQSVMILVYTPDQWDAELHLDQPHPTELGRNARYVLATPFRHEFTGRPGEADIPSILKTFRVRE